MNEKTQALRGCLIKFQTDKWWNQDVNPGLSNSSAALLTVISGTQSNTHLPQQENEEL